MFSWDARKAGKNLRKHGVPFEEAATVFADPEALDWEDLEHEAVAAICDRRNHEDKTGDGTSPLQGRVLLVVNTLRRMKDGRETIRLISARQASRKAREAYARQPD